MGRFMEMEWCIKVKIIAVEVARLGLFLSCRTELPGKVFCLFTMHFLLCVNERDEKTILQEFLCNSHTSVHSCIL